MTLCCHARLALLTLIGFVPLTACGETRQSKTLGLAVVDGVLLRDGKPYRGIGANYFDLFARVLHDPKDTSHRQGLARLGARASLLFASWLADSGPWTTICT